MPDGKASKGTGSVSLEIKDAAVGDGKAKLKGALALPKVDVGPITFAAEAKDGVLKISKLVAGGKDLEVQGDGRITMREMATDSLCDVQVRFRINDAYRNKNDVTKSLFGAPARRRPALFELADPKIKQAKRPDGFYGWSLRGPLEPAGFLPRGSGRRGSDGADELRLRSAESAVVAAPHQPRRRDARITCKAPGSSRLLRARRRSRSASRSPRGEADSDRVTGGDDWAGRSATDAGRSGRDGSDAIAMGAIIEGSEGSSGR